MTVLDDRQHVQAPERLREEVFEAGLLIETGVDGVYGRSATYMKIVSALDAMVSRWARELEAEQLQFPPILVRPTFAKTNYLESFPDLMGSVHVFRGDERQHREMLRRVENDGDWQELLQPAEVVLACAACHPVYPLCTGQVPENGRRFEISGFCFRHEPSQDPARMQAFHMHEVVYVGDRETAERHRDIGLERGLEELSMLGLSMTAAPANDPFFGRAGKVLAAGQLEEVLKIEGCATVSSSEKPTAIMSANCHRDHFGHNFEIEDSGGEVAHSACVAFGVDRITLALISAHGVDPQRWPAAVQQRLFS